MTEDEAKAKACCGPWAVNWAGKLQPGGEASRAQLCIGRSCMAWRGTVTDDFKCRAEAAYRQQGSHLSPGASDLDGFCGLAGQPS